MASLELVTWQSMLLPDLYYQTPSSLRNNNNNTSNSNNNTHTPHTTHTHTHTPTHTHTHTHPHPHTHTPAQTHVSARADDDVGFSVLGCRADILGTRNARAHTYRYFYYLRPPRYPNRPSETPFFTSAQQMNNRVMNMTALLSSHL